MNSQIYEEASAWVVRHRIDELDAEARREFDAWLRASPQHVRAYLEMSSIWEELPALDPSLNPAADRLVAHARTEGNVHPLVGRSAPQSTVVNLAVAQSPRVSGGPGSRRGGAWLHSGNLAALAASFVVAIGVAGWLYLQRDVYSTGVGEQRALLLADGSRVELNARSRIRVRYTERTRDIDLLSGQALFKVAKDHARPFIVATGDTHVRAVGTQFDVYRKKAGTVVSVLEGRVAVRTSDQLSSPDGSTRPSASGTGTAGAVPGRSPLQPYADEVLVEAGEQLVVTETPDGDAKRAQPVAREPVAGAGAVEAATAWTQQRLIFNAASLTELAEEFNRYNRRALVIDDATLKDFRISGNFSSTDPTLLIRFLRDQPEIVVIETGNVIHVTRRSPVI